LHLIKRHWPRDAYKHFRVAPGSIEHIKIIERGVTPFSRDEVLDQRALPGLPRACDDDRRHDPHTLGKGSSDQPRESLHATDDNHSRRE
jgi:hypothetical protein